MYQNILKLITYNQKLTPLNIKLLGNNETILTEHFTTKPTLSLILNNLFKLCFVI